MDDIYKYIKDLRNIDSEFATDSSIIPFSIGIIYRKLPHSLVNRYIDIVLENILQNKFFTNSTSKDNVKSQELISKFANTSRNIIVLQALLSCFKNNKYRKSEVKLSIEYLKKYLKTQFNDNNQPLNLKTVGYELTVSKYAGIKLFGFNKKIFKIYISSFRKLFNFSKTLIFSIESLPFFFQILIKKRILSGSTYLNKIFFGNSGNLTLFLYDNLNNDQQDFFNDYLNKKNGIPLFFKSEIFEISLIIDICLILGINKDNLYDLIYNLEIEASFDSIKGFSIAKDFNYYDADTTALTCKILNLLKGRNTSDELKNFNFKYYYRSEFSFYSTYYQDSRLSITTNAHILDYFSTVKSYREDLLELLLDCIEQDSLFDKWNSSILYVLFTVSNALYSFSLISKNKELVRKSLEIISNKIITFQKKTGGFSSDASSPENIYETVWAILSMKQLQKIDNKEELNKSLVRAKNYLSTQKSSKENLKFWLLTDTYSLLHVDKFIYKISKIL